jgi:hypothetical protein
MKYKLHRMEHTGSIPCGSGNFSISGFCVQVYDLMGRPAGEKESKDFKVDLTLPAIMYCQLSSTASCHLQSDVIHRRCHLQQAVIECQLSTSSNCRLLPAVIYYQLSTSGNCHVLPGVTHFHLSSSASCHQRSKVIPCPLLSARCHLLSAVNFWQLSSTASCHPRPSVNSF